MMGKQACHKTAEPSIEITEQKISNVYFFILFGFSFFSDKIFFNVITEKESFEDDKSELYHYILGKLNILLSFTFIVIIIAKEYIRNTILSLTNKDINFNPFFMSVVLIFFKLITLTVIGIYSLKSNSITGILVTYFLYIIMNIMGLGLSLFISLLYDSIKLISNWNMSSIRKKLIYQNSYIDTMPDSIKLILSHLTNRSC